MKTTLLALAVFLALAAGTASAARLDLGAGPYTTVVGKADRNGFTDTYEFETPLGAVSGSLTEHRSGNAVDIDWGDVAAITVFGGADPGGPVLFQYGGPYDPALVVSFEQLAVPAQFSVVVRGRAFGDGGDALPPVYGEYRLHLEAVAPAVPEPQALAMLLAGLGVVGGLRRRRSRH